MNSRTFAFFIIILTLLSCSDNKNEELFFDLEHYFSGKELFFKGKTNLPDGSTISIDLSYNDYSIKSGDKILVKDGQFQTKGYKSHNEKIIGKIDAKIVTYFNEAWQTEEVLKKLKEIESSLITIEDETKHINIKYQLVLGTPQEIEAKRNYCNKTHAFLLNVLQETIDRASNLSTVYENTTNNNKEQLKLAVHENTNWSKENLELIENSCFYYDKTTITLAIVLDELRYIGYAYEENNSKDIEFHQSVLLDEINNAKQEFLVLENKK